MPNDYVRYPEDAPEQMKHFAQEHNFSFPYVVDETQAVARAYDAVCTPDFFGFNAALELQYRGRLGAVCNSGHSGPGRGSVRYARITTCSLHSASLHAGTLFGARKSGFLHLGYDCCWALVTGLRRALSTIYSSSHSVYERK